MIMKAIQRIRDNTVLSLVLAILGAALYSVQAWVYAHIQTSFVDEGGYLYIGDLFLRGILRPFQDFGPPRWYSPLSYLIPGQIEMWFGTSLLTGRFFSVFCGIIMLIPLWLIAKRLGGKWWGVAIIWSIALTPISIQIFSLALSQALVACLLAWSLFFVLGEKRMLWQIAAGSILSGVVVMTRQNLLPLVPLLVAYVFWQHGKKAGWWALAGCLFPILVLHVIYWPNILQLWAIWLPARLTPFLNAYRFPVAELVSVSGASLSTRLLSFLLGFRFHYFTMLGFIVCLFLWPRRGEWKSQANMRAATFLATLFIVLTLVHAWATFFASIQAAQCTFCFTPYLSFFDITALLLIIVSFSSWKKKLSKSLQAGIVTFVLLLSTGLGFATYDRFGPWLLNIKFPAFTRGLDPRQWVPFITPWDILANKFHLDYWTSRLYVPIVAGLIAGIFLLVLARFVQKKLLKWKHAIEYSYGTLFLLASLGLGVWLSPLMGGTYRQDGLCQADIPQVHEEIGAMLSEVIPAGSQVYWEARTVVPLLYAPEIRIYSPQVYGLFSFRLGGDSQQMIKHGLWNDELARQWRAEADFIVTESNWDQIHRPGGDLDTTRFEEFRTAPTNPCDPTSYLIVYQRKP
jgi:hypothetical protein